MRKALAEFGSARNDSYFLAAARCQADHIIRIASENPVSRRAMSMTVASIGSSTRALARSVPAFAACPSARNLLRETLYENNSGEEGSGGWSPRLGAHEQRGLDQCNADPALNVFKRRLALLAGRRRNDLSLVRAFFQFHEPIPWRNTEQGHDCERPVIEPLGSLALRSAAIRIGRILTDVLLRDRTANLASTASCAAGSAIFTASHEDG